MSDNWLSREMSDNWLSRRREEPDKSHKNHENIDSRVPKLLGLKTPDSQDPGRFYLFLMIHIHC